MIKGDDAGISGVADVRSGARQGPELLEVALLVRVVRHPELGDESKELRGFAFF
jgi:hypothetical protein